MQKRLPRERERERLLSLGSVYDPRVIGAGEQADYAINVRIARNCTNVDINKGDNTKIGDGGPVYFLLAPRFTVKPRVRLPRAIVRG